VRKKKGGLKLEKKKKGDDRKNKERLRLEGRKK
jgi:hypothetical protein